MSIFTWCGGYSRAGKYSLKMLEAILLESKLSNLPFA